MGRLLWRVGVMRGGVMTPMRLKPEIPGRPFAGAEPMRRDLHRQGTWQVDIQRQIDQVGEPRDGKAMGFEHFGLLTFWSDNAVSVDDIGRGHGREVAGKRPGEVRLCEGLFLKRQGMRMQV